MDYPEDSEKANDNLDVWAEYIEDDDDAQQEIEVSGQIPNEGFQIRAYP